MKITAFFVCLTERNMKCINSFNESQKLRGSSCSLVIFLFVSFPVKAIWIWFRIEKNCTTEHYFRI